MARKQHRAILLQDVDHLGARGDVVSVKSGYLRNYLVPRRLAEQATEARIAEIKQTESVRARAAGPHDASRRRRSRARSRRRSSRSRCWPARATGSTAR